MPSNCRQTITRRIHHLIPQTQLSIIAQNGNGQYKLDKNGHLIVDHDLHSHDGELIDGIAEAFIEWANSEKLSFWVEG